MHLPYPAPHSYPLSPLDSVVSICRVVCWSGHCSDVGASYAPSLRSLQDVPGFFRRVCPMHPRAGSVLCSSAQPDIERQPIFLWTLISRRGRGRGCSSQQRSRFERGTRHLRPSLRSIRTRRDLFRSYRCPYLSKPVVCHQQTVQNRIAAAPNSPVSISSSTPPCSLSRAH